MDVQVMLNPAVLDVSAGSGGLISSLVCQLTGLLGSPALLGQVVGLLGGVGGGLLL